MTRPTRILLTVVLIAVGVQLTTMAPANATPPGVPSVTTARSELATLTVAAWTHTTTYNRDLFPTWDTISGTCDTRETVLKRDGTSVVVNSACTPTSGTWHSPYDGATWTAVLRRRHRSHGHPQKRLGVRRLGLDHHQT